MPNASPRIKHQKIYAQQSAIPSSPFRSYAVPLLPIFMFYPNSHMMDFQRVSPTVRQRLFFVPTHPEIASDSASSSLEIKIDPIEARAF
ncbi:uncharacterized protein N7500_006997 [Penicillium coprophilum]|uniref:uncharacterized protein n=1 Tax=Penicillium coprophilum TaxID=36646 RepID=UPI0023A273A1|nr:uncharacterized protein N7500_006997 [Penicillium coprophilum]KAJ5165167.1 hypothetical protein N7500_006997 [Penicillium coprophilum]